MALALLLTSSACAKESGGILPKDCYSVEFGERFSERPTGTFEVTIIDENGNTVPTQFGSFTPSIGTYTAVYTSGGKKQTVTIVCADTKGPDISVEQYATSVSAGDTVYIPRYNVSDLSGVKTQGVKVYRSDGSEQAVSAEGYWVCESDVYTVVISAQDNAGNSSERRLVVTARAFYIDDEKKAGEYLTFDNKEYINLVYGSVGEESFTASVVDSGYPAIEGEKERNGVLKLTTDLNYGDVYARISPNDPVKACEFGKIVFKVCVDKDTDYVKILSSDGNGIAGAAYMLKANEWTDIYVDPIDFGYGNELTDIAVFARADCGLTLYIDEVTYTERWKDENRAENVIADFDEAEYANNVYQNIYNNNGVMMGGSRFTIADYPGAGTCLKVETSATYGGFTYMFDEPVVLDEIESIVVKIAAGTCANLWFGGMQGNYRGGNAYYGLGGWYTNWQKFVFDQMQEIVVPAYAAGDTSLSDICGDGVLTGIWIAVVDGNSIGNTVYVDEIRVNYKV